MGQLSESVLNARMVQALELSRTLLAWECRELGQTSSVRARSVTMRQQ